MALFEQIVERLPGARRPRRAGLTLHRRSRREIRAVVARILRGYTGRQLNPAAFEPRTGIKGRALDAAVQIDAATAAPRLRRDGEREQIAAAGAAKHFVRAHQVWRARSGCVLQRPPGRPRFPRFPRRGLTFWPRAARLVLISALPVFPSAVVAHTPSIMGGWPPATDQLAENVNCFTDSLSRTASAQSKLDLFASRV